MNLVARRASAQLGRREVLAELDLEVRPGELLVVAGPNGSGKSTMLALLAGDLAPSSGEVLLDGTPVSALPAAELARRRAVVLQQGTTPFGFTVREVVRMGRAPWRDPPLETELRVDDALSATGVLTLADRLVHRLSGGERARVDLARALVQGTPLLLLDEATASLDVRHAHEALALARGAADRGRAVVAVVHDLGLVGSYAHRVALLHEGRLVAIGRPDEVLVAERLSCVYGHEVLVLPHPVDGSPLVVPAPASQPAPDRRTSC